MTISELFLGLTIFGLSGTMLLLILTGITLWYYRNSPAYSFRWHWRTFRLKQICAIGCLFFLAMAASYGVLQEAWLFIYLIAAIKCGTWWFRMVISQRA